ncbi:MAG: hypothetical protein COT81_03765 [Candidatus Buchananbacteria bacterium CG10_big_fil_rev_8_21_14_0_10_42_9]|uniref:Bacterial type II secretion system protein E domain-containing protein n=1 Tax=Candidatus Buchananbacteria bacterium CG10_big_fil_rev_8_21_14_0_10_42_9 TaxID=1974526 RepID=A0A2H0W0S4_9BACT|nr:MAG: hypothetical protein COT81_03765 [Candidatus Buchananbacteria bacterium CG10_big_fil_rev_8_21_14_0_10_42_9]
MATAGSLEVNKILTTAAKNQASDLHLSAGSPPVMRIGNDLVEMANYPAVKQQFILDMIDSVLTSGQKEQLAKNKDLIFTYEFAQNLRFRVNIIYQRGKPSVSLRYIPISVPDIQRLGLPIGIEKILANDKGLIVVTGPYGAGRTTTVAAMIEHINQKRDHNIVTIEQPIEYLFTNKKSIIEQREVGVDVNSFHDALLHCQREDVNVVAVGENHEPELIPSILEVANNNVLVFLVLNTSGILQTVEYLIGNFRVEEKERAQKLLSDSLRAILVQRLLPQVGGGGKKLAAGLLINNDAVKTSIRKGEYKNLINIAQTSKNEGMVDLDQALVDLVRSGEVLVEDAEKESFDKQNFRSLIAR